MVQQVLQSTANGFDSIDAYETIGGDSSKQVHLQILHGDITKENTQAVVVFRSTAGMAKGDSMILLLTAGDGIEAEYLAAKAIGGKHVGKGIVLTGPGQLVHRKHILHLHVSDNIPKFRETIFAALRLAEKMELKSISFPSVPDEFHTEKRRNILPAIFCEFPKVDHPVCLHFIQLVSSHGIDWFKQLLYSSLRTKSEK